MTLLRSYTARSTSTFGLARATQSCRRWQAGTYRTRCAQTPGSSLGGRNCGVMPSRVHGDLLVTPTVAYFAGSHRHLLGQL